MDQNIENVYHDLVDKIKRYSSSLNEDLLKKAVEWSHNTYREKLHFSGKPYFEHCLNVAQILVDLKMDYETIIAGLLHAIIIDTEITTDEIRKNFNESIANLVSGFSQISELRLKSNDLKQEDILRKLILSIAKDLRVIIIKFADQLERLRAIDVTFDERNKTFVQNIAQETMSIYAPLAHRLGVNRIKQELEDLSFKFLNHDTYQYIQQRLTESRDVQERYINLIINELSERLRSLNVEAKISGRPKSIYSIHKKMVNRGYSLDKISDILAIRIIVKEGDSPDTRYRDCYTALSVVQELYKPIQSLYADYITNPRENGYQSIHIKALFEPQQSPLERRIVEVQIRTDKMHEKAETGIAAHWLYKERKSKMDEVDEKLSFIRQKVLEDALDPDKFMQSLNIDDLFRDDIFIFSPDRDLWQLPKGSTPVDFAFHVHTDVGLHCLGAKINGKLVQLNTELKSGDTVEIITSNNQQPNRDWLKFVKTNKAKSRIRHWMKQSQFEQSRKLGEEMLNKALKSFHLEISNDELRSIARTFKFDDYSNFLSAIGLGELTINNVIRAVAPEKLNETNDESLLKRIIKRAKGNEPGVKVQGEKNLLITFAKCCQPLPGDKITGFVVRGKGVVIHRTDCKNVPKLLENPDRNIDVQWAIDPDKKFVSRINMIAENHRGFLRSVTDTIEAMNSNIVSIDMKTKDTLLNNIMAIEVLNVNHLARIISKLKSIKGVIRVDRIEGDGSIDYI
ncbi:bifunctional (p)ppGpp synthetase/guanosine-3',5'-bis(diphosphate) 3'-pyrophosphohydrolase [candidate division KSB1 bacterium]|nr:bifunctional (p)ppGpp synthetase/guanosine-3',5'-bis(diphosphate) 3'-pyrophosphohydrolase [candidate division KSB1 bacterium]